MNYTVVFKYKINSWTKINEVHGDPNQNLKFALAITLKIHISDPIVDKAKALNGINIPLLTTSHYHNLANCQEHEERHLIVDVSTQSHAQNQQMVMLTHYHKEGPKLSQCIASCANTLESFKWVSWHSNCILPAIERASGFWLIYDFVNNWNIFVLKQCILPYALQICSMLSILYVSEI